MSKDAKNCKILNDSPSKTPQINATIGIIYVTEEANTGVDICTNLKNNIFAKAVPKTDNIVIYINALGKAGLANVSVVKKPLNKRITSAGITMNT